MLQCRGEQEEGRRLTPSVEATPAPRRAEVAATKTLLTRTQESFGLTPQTLAADAAYGSGLMVGWLIRRGVEPHIPILDHAHQTKGYFTRAGFLGAANVLRLVGLHQPAFSLSLRYLLFLLAFAPRLYLAYDDANNSRNGRKVAPV
jgi:hypothetical protein